MQVAPAELEAFILTHEAVSDCVVIGVPSEREGEIPKAFVVKAPGSIEESDAMIKRKIKQHVEKGKSRHKWLDGGVEFIDVVVSGDNPTFLASRVLVLVERLERFANVSCLCSPRALAVRF